MQCAKRAPGRGYVGEGNRPAGAYYSDDFDYDEHLERVLPLIEAQLAAARALQAAAPAAADGQEVGQAEAAAQAERVGSGAAASPASAGGSGGDGAGNGAPQLSARARRRQRNAELKRERRRQQQEAAAADKACGEAQAQAQLRAGADAGSGGDGGGGGSAAGAASGADARPGPSIEEMGPLAGAGVEGSGGGADPWEVFFREHQTARFFRERRYLGLSFPCLAAPPAAASADTSSSGGGDLSSSTISAIGGGAGDGSSSGVAAASSGASDSGGDAPGLSHIVELGAGCGSSILPLLKLHPRARATVCDVSATCLRQLLAAARADGIAAPRVRAFVADATDPSLAAELARDPADAALIMFTLSAVPPGEAGMLAMLRNAAAALRPGGRLCVRDHGVGDLVQLRIPPHQVVFEGGHGRGAGGAQGQWEGDGAGRQASGGSGEGAGGGPGGPYDRHARGSAAGSSGRDHAPDRPSGHSHHHHQQQQQRHYYRRGDGTLAYFYRPDELAAMGEAAGLVTEMAEVATVVNRNRRTGQEMRRVFVQAQFVKPARQGGEEESGGQR